MKMIGDYDWDIMREVSDFDLNRFEVAINLIRREWLNRMDQIAFNIYGEKSARNKNIPKSLPEDYELEKIRNLRFWYEELLRAYEELKAIKERKGKEEE